jgi:hypothetical protein
MAIPANPDAMNFNLPFDLRKSGGISVVQEGLHSVICHFVLPGQLFLLGKEHS